MLYGYIKTDDFYKDIETRFDRALPKGKNKKLNPNWPQIPDHTYRILMLGGSGCGKTNSLFNLINQQSDIDKMYLHANVPYEAKYHFLFKKQESTGLKHLNDSKTFVEYLNDMDDIKIFKNTIEIKNAKY